MPRKKPAPAEVPEAAPGIGHNEPPEPTAAALPVSGDLAFDAEQWTKWLTHVFGAASARRTELLAGLDRAKAKFALKAASTPGAPPIGIDAWDDEVAGKMGDFRQQFADLVKAGENLHALEKAPVLVATRAIDGFKNRFVDPLNSAIADIRGWQTLYLREKEAITRRTAAEEAERLRKAAEEQAATAAQTMRESDLDQAAEAFGQAAEAQAQATAPAADLSRVRGAHGSVTSLRGLWKFFPTESDLMTLVRAVAEGKAPLDYLTFNETRLGFAVRSEKVRDVPGCVIRQDLQA